MKRWMQWIIALGCMTGAHVALGAEGNVNPGQDSSALVAGEVRTFKQFYRDFVKLVGAEDWSAVADKALFPLTVEASFRNQRIRIQDKAELVASLAEIMAVRETLNYGSRQIELPLKDLIVSQVRKPTMTFDDRVRFENMEFVVDQGQWKLKAVFLSNLP